MAKRKSRTKSAAGGGPFLQIAVICEKALTERDGVQSLIRLFDKATIPRMTAPADPGQVRVIPITMVIGFKSGDFVGTKSLSVDATARRVLGVGQATEVTFTGEEQGPLIVIETKVAVSGPELIWFDIRLDKKLLGRIPLRIEVAEDHLPAKEESERGGKQARQKSRSRRGK
jgi:hypothetical protein